MRVLDEVLPSQKNVSNITNSTDIQNNTNFFDDSNLLQEKYVWGAAIGVSLGYLVLSLILTALILLCVTKKKSSKKCLSLIISVFLALAVGSLIGDSVVHIMPDVFGPKSADVPLKDLPDSKISSLMILLGFFVFFILEKIFVLVGCGHSHGHDDEDDEHSHSDHILTPDKDDKIHSPKHNDQPKFPLESEHIHSKDGKDHKQIHVEVHGHSHSKGSNCDSHADHSHQKKPSTSKENKNSKRDAGNQIPIDNQIELEIKKEEEKENQESKEKTEKENPYQLSETVKIIGVQEIDLPVSEEKPKQHALSLINKNPMGILILISCFIHNIMDGISIGIVFASRDKALIISTNIAILLHEVPKELGDAGVLIHSKFTLISVLFWNVINNISSVIGVIIGLAVGQISEASKSYSLAFVAGNFYYISLAEMVPELIRKKGFWNHFSHFFFIIVGIGIMFSLLYIEN